MRHAEDEKRLVHENDGSRLEHEDSADETALTLRHDDEDSNGEIALKHEGATDGETPSSSENATEPAENKAYMPVAEQVSEQPDTQGSDADMGQISNLTSKALHIFDQILPDDRENDAVQAIKHDILEAPAAFLDAVQDVQDMRNRGQRLFFENKDKDDSSNDIPVVERIAESDDAHSSEPILTLPPSNEAEAIEAGDSPLLLKTPQSGSENPAVSVEAVGKNDERDKRGEEIRVAVSGKDYYVTLGISETADDGEIKSAYRELAKKYHPDVNLGDKGAEAKFKEANEAYSVLIDPQKRQVYDQKRVAIDKASEKSIIEKSSDNVQPKAFTEGESDKKPHSSGKNNDRFMRRVLDSGYISSQVTAKLMTDEQEEEYAGTKGIRAMLSEGAKLVKIFDTAERKPSKLRHAEDDEQLTHEDDTEESPLEHEATDGEDDVLQLEAPKDNLGVHKSR